MLLDADDSQLVLVDYQARLMPAIHDGPAVLANARRLAQAARLMGVPVWATEQNPTRLGGTDADLAAMADMALQKGQPHIAVLLAKQAAERGVILPDAYFPIPDAGVEDYFRAVAEATDGPVVLYTNPQFQRSDLSIPVRTIAGIW